MKEQDDDPAAGAWTRRALMKAGLATGALAAANPLLSPAASAAPAPAAASALPFELEEATIADLQAALASGKETARSLTEKYLARIDALNTKGPELRAVIEINPEALAIADALDAERRGKGSRGPLHGIPILIKDNIDTADRMTTTAGSLALEGSIPSRDAFVAARLRAAGAILLGKTNLSEWANFRSTRSSSGWSGRGGQCRNPYALDRNALGLQLGLRRGGRRQPRRRHRGHGDGRLDRLPLRRSAASSASSRPSACSAAPGSSRSPTPRTPPAPWPAPSPTPRSCSAP